MISYIEPVTKQNSQMKKIVIDNYYYYFDM